MPHSSQNLSRRALYEDVADSIRQRIFAHALEPGEWIDEIAIAQELGISRTPMREALKVLAAEGLVTMKVRRGAYVAEVNQQDLQEVYQMLGLLEADAAAQVAAGASAGELAELQAIHDALEQTVTDREAFFRHNEQFHRRLVELAGNRWQLQIVNDLRKVMKLSRHHSLFRPGRTGESLLEHRQIMQALQQRDPLAARQLTALHLANGLKAAAPAAMQAVPQ